MSFVITNLSNMIIPALVFYIIAYGRASHCKIYEDFVKGAKEGLKTVVGIMPTLVALMIAVGVLRSSGFLDFLEELFLPVSEYLHFPAQLLPLSFIRMFSSSAATGLVLDIFKNYGTDSYIGLVTSIMMSCTETIFYTISVYFMATGDKDHKPVTGMRWTLAGALLCTVAGMAASIVLTRILL